MFAFPTKALNICNSRTNAIPQVGAHLGVIGLHPLHSPPFVRVYFTPKNIFGFISLCISHLVTNPMLGLWHMPCLLQLIVLWHLSKVIRLFLVACVHYNYKRVANSIVDFQFSFNEIKSHYYFLIYHCHCNMSFEAAWSNPLIPLCWCFNWQVHFINYRISDFLDSWIFWYAPFLPFQCLHKYSNTDVNPIKIKIEI